MLSDDLGNTARCSRWQRKDYRKCKLLFIGETISNKYSQNCRKISGELGAWLYFSEFNKIDKKIIKGLKEKNINTLYLSLKYKEGDYLLGNDIKNFVASLKSKDSRFMQ